MPLRFNSKLSQFFPGSFLELRLKIASFMVVSWAIFSKEWRSLRNVFLNFSCFRTKRNMSSTTRKPSLERLKLASITLKSLLSTTFFYFIDYAGGRTSGI